eukprot:3941715-Rhodomonas_salina.3
MIASGVRGEQWRYRMYRSQPLATYGADSTDYVTAAPRCSQLTFLNSAISYAAEIDLPRRCPELT